MTTDDAGVETGHRGHRGAHPEDARLFGPAAHPGLHAAVCDMSWLLTRGYSPHSSLKLVGDRYRLHERQRRAVGRAACPDGSLSRRQAALRPMEDLRGRDVVIDGFNLLITVEAALGRGVLIRGRDGCVRDMSSVHGSYRTVQETDRALAWIGDSLAPLGPAAVTWLLDKPVSNSGRLARTIADLADAHGWPWCVDLLWNPDEALVASGDIIVTSDSNVLDRAGRWVNLGAALVEALPERPWLVDLKD